jgi:hypothetical protein
MVSNEELLHIANSLANYLNRCLEYSSNSQSSSSSVSRSNVHPASSSVSQDRLSVDVRPKVNYLVDDPPNSPEEDNPEEDNPEEDNPEEDNLEIDSLDGDDYDATYQQIFGEMFDENPGMALIRQRMEEIGLGFNNELKDAADKEAREREEHLERIYARLTDEDIARAREEALKSIHIGSDIDGYYDALANETTRILIRDHS